MAVGGPYLARLVDMDGNGKKWRVDTPKWVVDDSDEEEDKVEEPSKKQGRGAPEEPKAVEEGSTSTEPLPEVVEQAAGRRKGRAKQPK